MSNLAETILRDVPRYGTDPDDCDGFIPTPDGAWLDRDEVLAAITAALDPALSERAGEVLEGVTPGPWAVDGEDQGAAWGMAWSVHAAENILDVKCDGVDTEENARFIAWCREGVPALLAQIAALRADAEEKAQEHIRVCNYAAELEAERDALRAERDVSNELGRAFEQDAGQQRALAEAAEAQIAALTAQAERLTGALDKARTQDRDPDYVYDEEWEYTMRWDEWPDLVDGHDLTEPMPIYTLYKGPTKWVVQIPIDTDGDGETDDFETKLFDSEETARAALSTTEAGHDPQA